MADLEFETQRAGSPGLANLVDAWPLLAGPERVEGLLLLDREEAIEHFLRLPARAQAEIILEAPPGERRSWVRLLASNDAADVIQEVPVEDRDALMALLPPASREQILALLAYAEDSAGGLMNPHFVRARPDMTVDESITYLRRQAQSHPGEFYYAYVLDGAQRLTGVVSFRKLFQASGRQRVNEIMRTNVVVVPEGMDQEEVSHLMAHHDVMALPVVDAEGRMKGIITVDDIVDVVREEATEDIHKLGGLEALDAPYWKTSFGAMLKKRAGWLTVLFLGEMLTATAMGHYEREIAQAVILTLFLPLIISSGGNSGAQATTLIIRAMALGEVRLRDWWRVLAREFSTGLALGLVLGLIGLLRIVLGESLFHGYGEHYLLLAVTVAVSLTGVVLWGTLAGALLPILLKRAGFDPASASAPSVATIVDVTGLIIYFSSASAILHGTLL